MALQDVPSHRDVTKNLQSITRQLYAANSDWIMPLTSAELKPLQLCQELTSFIVSSECGHLITELTFLENLPKLTHLEMNGPQIRDVGSLATLPSLVCSSFVPVASHNFRACAWNTATHVCLYRDTFDKPVTIRVIAAFAEANAAEA